jgi:hypothetical protein
MTGEIEEIFFKSAMFSPKLALFLQISYILTTFSQGMTGENPNLCKGLELLRVMKVKLREMLGPIPCLPRS